MELHFVLASQLISLSHRFCLIEASNLNYMILLRQALCALMEHQEVSSTLRGGGLVKTRLLLNSKEADGAKASILNQLPTIATVELLQHLDQLMKAMDLARFYKLDMVKFRGIRQIQLHFTIGIDSSSYIVTVQVIRAISKIR